MALLGASAVCGPLQYAGCAQSSQAMHSQGCYSTHHLAICRKIPVSAACVHCADIGMRGAMTLVAPLQHSGQGPCAVRIFQRPGIHRIEMLMHIQVLCCAGTDAYRLADLQAYVVRWLPGHCSAQEKEPLLNALTYKEGVLHGQQDSDSTPVQAQTHTGWQTYRRTLCDGPQGTTAPRARSPYCTRWSCCSRCNHAQLSLSSREIPAQAASVWMLCTSPLP